MLRGYGSTALVGASPTPSATEAIRLDQEPVPKTGRGREALGRSSRPASSTRRDGREVKTPGPQPGGRGSIPRRGTQHTPTQMPEETKRSRARRAGRRSGVDSARWSSGKTSGCYPEGGGSSPSLAAHDEINARWPRSSGAWQQTTRRGCESLPGVHRNTATRGRRPTARMPVRHIGDEGSSPSDHTQQRPTQHRPQRKGARCPPTSTTS